MTPKRAGLPAQPAAAPGATTSSGPRPGNPGPWPAPAALNPLAHQAGNDALTTAGLANTQRGYDQGLLQVGHAEDRLRRQFGFAEVAAGTQGAVQDRNTGRWFAVDVANNPYSDAARLKQQWEQRHRARRSNDAAGGFMYDGSAARGEIGGQRGERADHFALAEQFLAGQGDLQLQRQQLFQQAIDQALGIHGDQLERDALRELPGQGDPDGDGLVQDPGAIAGSTPDGSHPPHTDHQGEQQRKRRRRRRKRKGKR